MPDSVYRFGRFELRATERVLLGDGHAVELGARAFDVLQALIERRDRVVSKDELLELAWPGLIVEENNLQVQVSALRKVLGADAIATIPGRGYRFTAQTATDASGLLPPTCAQAPVGLPRMLNAFIGREAELAEYAPLVAQARLLTLTALGGCGKTRLAIELARRVAGDFAGGVWFVDLAPIAAPDRVALAVMSLLGVREDPERSAIDLIAARLDDKPALLVLDNCEHVLEAVGTFVEALLSRTASATVLATSRERLGIAGEQAALVKPLAVAAPGKEQERSDAARLFLDRARLTAPDLVLGVDALDAVEDICRHLEGLPLAIELAAARMKVLSIAELKERLADRLRLLTASGRSHARHQTLRDVIAWSYEQLEPGEQEAFRRLAVFAGGWTLDAANAVAMPSLTENDTLDLLARLVDKSLVFTDRAQGPATRYRMLETVREYARERLESAGEGEDTRARHVRYFVELAERTEPSQVKHDISTLARLDVELDNIVAAHDECAGPPPLGDLDLRLVAALTYWFVDRHLRLGRSLVERTLARCGAGQGGRAYAGALRNAGRIADELGDHVASLRYLAQAVEAARTSHAVDIELDALWRLGGAEYEAEQLTQARMHLNQALAGARAHGVTYSIMGALMGLGELDRIEGRLDDAALLYEEALEIQRTNGFVRQVEFNLSIVANERGDYAQAARYLRDMSLEAQTLGSPYLEWSVLQHAAALAAVTGDAPFAARMWGAFGAAAEATGLSVQRADEPFLTRRIDAAKAALGASAFGAMLDAGRALTPREALAEFDAWTDRYLAAAGSNGDTDAGGGASTDELKPPAARTAPSPGARGPARRAGARRR